ncbi:MAG: efflux RND transporter permease subunit [Rhodospirillales bacterium]|nr:efflux RND transporter permease subunit [Rhodospirillales bacterium]MCY4002126.1 efflux RND transporter permease subunit [Rhodospirillales bacterium]
MNRVVAWFAAHSVAATLLTIFAVLGGAAAMLLIPVKPYPDFEVPAVVVSMAYPGAAPEEVEAGVCRLIEDRVEGIVGIKTVRSTAAEGLCTVRMDLVFDADHQRAADEIQSRVRSIDTFPADAEQLLVRRVMWTNVVAEVVVTGPAEERALKELGRRVRDDLLNLPGITQVGLANDRPYEISVEISEASLQRQGMTFDDVARALRRRSVDLSGGAIASGAGEVLLRTRGQAYWGEEFEEFAVRVRPDGIRVLLKDVARIVDGFADTDQGLWFDGRRAVLLQIARVGNQDARGIVTAVREYIQAAAARYPDGVRLTLWTDESSQLADRLSTLIDAGAQGLLLVLILLMLFLRPHLAIWVAVGIPVAFLGAAFLIYLLGLSLDAVSIIGFIIALGMIVDDAVVVGESTHAAQRSSESRLAGAVRGTQRVIVPVTFGVLTTIAAFMPLMFATGVVGQALSIVAVVVVCCLVASLIECQCILPAHLGSSNLSGLSGEFGVALLMVATLGAFVAAPDAHTGAAVAVAVTALLLACHIAGPLAWAAKVFAALQTRFEGRLDAFVEGPFRQLVRSALRNRRVTVAFAMTALVTAFATVLGGHLPFTVRLPYEGDRVLVQLTMPPGTDAAVTRGVLRDIEGAARRIKVDLANEHGEPVVLHILEAMGGHPSAGVSLTAVSEPSGPHLGEVAIQLTPGERRPVDTGAVAALLRERMGAVPQGAKLNFVVERTVADPDIDIRLTSHDLDDLSALVTALRAELARYPGVHEVNDTLIPGKEEFELSVTSAGEAMGVSLFDVGRQLRQAYHGEEVQRIQRGEDDIRVMVRYTDTERRSLGSLENMHIRMADGGEVPLAAVSELRLRQGLSAIHRTDGFRSANVTARVDLARTSANAVLTSLDEGFLPRVVGDYPGAAYRIDSLREQEEMAGAVLPPLVLALFAIYALLSLPLRSYTQPLAVLSVVPFVWIGAVWGHALLKLSGHIVGLSMASVFGMVAASGVAINATLVLLHALNERRAAGASLEEGLAAAAVSRLRPILITTVTTFAGLAPLMFSRSVAAQSLVPLAVSLAFGILVAAVAALLVVPAVWLALSGVRTDALQGGRSTSPGRLP